MQYKIAQNIERDPLVRAKTKTQRSALVGDDSLHHPT
jgi:hypothetical protein